MVHNWFSSLPQFTSHLHPRWTIGIKMPYYLIFPLVGRAPMVGGTLWWLCRLWRLEHRGQRRRLGRPGCQRPRQGKAYSKLLISKSSVWPWSVSISVIINFLIPLINFLLCRMEVETLAGTVTMDPLLTKSGRLFSQSIGHLVDCSFSRLVIGTVLDYSYRGFALIDWNRDICQTLGVSSTPYTRASFIVFSMSVF